MVLGASDFSASRIKGPAGGGAARAGYPGYPGFPSPQQQQQQQYPGASYPGQPSPNQPPPYGNGQQQQQQQPPFYPSGGDGAGPGGGGLHALPPPAYGQPPLHQRVGEIPANGVRRGQRPGTSPIAEALGTAGGLMAKVNKKNKKKRG
jgi:hypothetical protein